MSSDVLHTFYFMFLYFLDKLERFRTFFILNNIMPIVTPMGKMNLPLVTIQIAYVCRGVAPE